MTTEDINFWRRVVATIDLAPVIKLNSWERRFIKDMITNPDKLPTLTYRQKEKLLVILEKVQDEPETQAADPS